MDLPSDAHIFRSTLFIPGLCRSQSGARAEPESADTQCLPLSWAA